MRNWCFVKVFSLLLFPSLPTHIKGLSLPKILWVEQCQMDKVCHGICMQVGAAWDGQVARTASRKLSKAQ